MDFSYQRRILVTFTVTLVLFFSVPVYAQDPDTQPVQQSAQADPQPSELEQRRSRIVELINSINDVETMRKLYDFFLVQSEIRAHFVDNKTFAELLELAMVGMVDGLDPYSNLFIGKAAESLYAEFTKEQEYVGIGITITNFHKNIYVVEVHDNSSASAAGMVAGAMIMRVNGKSTYGLNTAEVSAMIKGDEGSAVEIEVKNPRSQKPRILKMVRRALVVESITSRNIGRDVVYARIRTFMPYPDVVVRFEDVLRKSVGKKLIIDLRGNGGGSLQAVNEMVGAIIGPGKVLISERSREREVFVNTPDASYAGGLPAKIVVLIDNNSASASEIMAGNFKHYKSATIVGVRSLGKATVQQYIGLDTLNHNMKDSQLILGITIERYYLPDGTNITGNGVGPNVEVEQPDDFQPFERLTKRDLQFQKALEILKRK